MKLRNRSKKERLRETDRGREEEGGMKKFGLNRSDNAGKEGGMRGEKEERWEERKDVKMTEEGLKEEEMREKEGGKKENRKRREED